LASYSSSAFCPLATASSMIPMTSSLCSNEVDQVRKS
jgi:hypothetical protein